jgi:hypothetical protein
LNFDLSLAIWYFRLPLEDQKGAAVLVPPIVFDVDDIAMHRFDRRSCIPTRMASVLVKIALVSLELVLQISLCTKESVIQ